MLDIRIVREKPEYVKERVRLRGGDHWMLVDKVLECDERRRAAETEKQALSQERNSSSKLIGQMMKEGRREEAEELKKRMGEVGDRIKELDAVSTAAGEEQEQLLLSIPNMPHDGAPVGLDETANPELRQWGSKPEIADPKDHVEIGTRLGLLNFEDAARISGSGFIVYRGLGARLERALINFLLDTQTLENGYQETGVPFMVRRECMYGTGQLPKFEEDLFKLREFGYYLIPTAEVPVTNLHAGETLDEADLPRAYCAATPCFRSEAGAAGKDTRGLIRMHQFTKVEMVRFAHPDDSMNQLEIMLGHARHLLETLELPHRVITLCTGDMGFGAVKTYDVEVWLPAQNTYREISSCSNCGDFQARRAGIRFKAKGGKAQFVHTLNGSGLPTGRTMAAILENGQQKDGSIVLPKALVPYMNGVEVIEPRAGKQGK